MKKIRQHTVTILSVIAILFGAWLLIQPHIRNHTLKTVVQETNQQIAETLTPEIIEENKKADVTYDYEDVRPVTYDEVMHARQNPENVYSVGDIVIPSVGIHLNIGAGTSNYTMMVGAGTLRPDTEFGKGNVVLASHFMGDYSDLLFSPLKRVSIGDDIYISDMQHIYRYTITDYKVVSPDHTEVVEQTNEPIITLITCDDLDAVNRVVVQGRLSEIYDAKTAPQNVLNSFTIAKLTAW